LVARVPAAMTSQTRKVSRQAGKSDPIEARAVALAVVRDGIESFPVAFTDAQVMEIRILSDYRDQIICERTRTINRLRWHLVTIAPDLEAQLGQAALKGPRVCARLTRQLARLPQSPRLRVARLRLARITETIREERQLLAELTILIDAHAPQLLAQPGCGTVTAAIIVGHTAGAKRFPSDGHFARHTGTAPVPASSGKTQRHRLHRGGDRQLNRALHIIALSRPRADPETRAYLARKQAEGKTKLEAIRCLKRHLARRIWRLLYTAEMPVAPPRVDQSLKPGNTDFLLTYRYENSRCEKCSAIVSGGGVTVVGPGGWGFRGRTQIGQAAICSLGFEPVDIAGRPCD
jgi:transposase